MTDAEIPDSLLALKRRFIQADTELAALSETMPSGLAIIAGDAAEDPADRERWNALHKELGTLVEQIHGHSAFEGLSQVDQYKLREAASKAARASL